MSTDVLRDHKRHVIVESTAGPLGQFAESRFGELFGRRVIDVRQPTGHPVTVEELAGAIASFRHAIRIQQQTIAGAKMGNFRVGVLRVGKEPEHHAIVVFDERRLTAFVKQSRWMSGIGNNHRLSIGVYHGVHRCHISTFKVATEDLIHGGEDSGRIVGVLLLRRKRDLHHRRDERGRNPMSRHVCDKDAET